MRAKRRNTVIALMIVFSATLPTFLGTTAALTESNFDVVQLVSFTDNNSIQFAR